MEFERRMPVIAHVESPEQLGHIRQLFREYATFLGFDLAFQGFDEELAGLPGEYSPPAGRLLLAIGDGKVAGCVAVREIEGRICEMKRLYVRPEFRGMGIGRALATAAVREAKRAGYSRMRLDTVPALAEAIALYRSLGFREIEPYRYNPIEGATFWELEL